MKFTVECFKEIPIEESSLLYDEKGNKIHVPSFLDDDELFLEDDDEKFSSLLPSKQGDYSLELPEIAISDQL